MSPLEDYPGKDRFVDWDGGYVYVWATGPSMVEGAASAALARRLSLEAAWTEIQARLSDIALTVPFDATLRVGDILGGGGRKAQKAFRNFLQAAEPVKVFYRADASAGVWARAPLYGRHGLAFLADKRVSEREEEKARDPVREATPGTTIVLWVHVVPPMSIRTLWPSLITSRGDRFADLASLSREGALAPDFAIRRERREEAALDPLLTPETWQRALKVRQHENGVDYILEPVPDGRLAFDAGNCRLLIIVEE